MIEYAIFIVFHFINHLSLSWKNAQQFTGDIETYGWGNAQQFIGDLLSEEFDWEKAQDFIGDLTISGWDKAQNFIGEISPIVLSWENSQQFIGEFIHKQWENAQHFVSELAAILMSWVNAQQFIGNIDVGFWRNAQQFMNHLSTGTLSLDSFLLMEIIWVIILFAPAIIIGWMYGKFGTIFGLLLMGGALMMFGILPLWLFMVIILGCGTMLYKTGGV